MPEPHEPLEGMTFVGDAGDTEPDAGDIDDLPVIGDVGDYNADWLRHLAGSPHAAGTAPEAAAEARRHADRSPGVVSPDSLPAGVYRRIDINTEHVESTHWLDDGRMAEEEPR